MYNGAPSAGNPQVTQSLVVLNADFDRYYLKYAGQNSTKQNGDGRVVPVHLRRGVAADCFNLMPRELCFTIRSEFDSVLQRSKAGQTNLRDMRVFSSANYMPVLMNPSDYDPASRGLSEAERRKEIEKHCKNILRNQVAFVGVPLTKVLFDENMRVVGNDKVPVQISGSTTIWNTGPFDIHPGDVILWDIPWGDNIADSCKPIPGLPSDKKSFWTVPLRHAIAGNGAGDDVTVPKLFDMLMGVGNATDASFKFIRKHGLGTDETFSNTAKDLFATAAASAGADPLASQAVQEKLKNLLFLWNVEWSSYTSRVIGRALKGASPGMAFDIMLQRAI